MSQPHNFRKSIIRESSSFAHDVISSSHLPSSNSDPSFVCTICWQPQYPPHSPGGSKLSIAPKLLGSSARIVCHQCWRAVLDLSICWVCGDCIVRGNEVVSLGWCFWHRGCFGCLVCGSSMDVPSNHDDCSIEHGRWRSLEEIEDRIGGADRTGKGIGVELNEIPLCRICQIECAGETRGEVLERGLETISRFDGGLSRDRLKMLSEDQEGDIKLSPKKLTRIRRLRGATGIESSLQRYINHSSYGSFCLQSSDCTGTDDEKSLLQHAAEMGGVEEHPVSIDQSMSDTKVAHPFMNLETAQQVYISILDPIRESAFKPSKTKPLPKWMSLLPSNVEREWGRKITTMSQSQASRTSLVSGSPPSNDGKDVLSEPISKRQSQKPTNKHPSTPIDIPKSKRRTTSISFVDDGLTGCTRALRKSQTLDSDYATPPEFPQRGLPIERRPTPFPRDSRPKLDYAEITSVSKCGKSELKRHSHLEQLPMFDESTHSSSLPLPQFPPSSAYNPLGSAGPRPSLPLEHSTEYLEYLDRYHSMTTDKSRRMSMPRSSGFVMDKIKKHKAKTAKQAAQHGIRNVTCPDNDEEDQSLDSRMLDLKQELREFFEKE